MVIICSGDTLTHCLSVRTKSKRNTRITSRTSQTETGFLGQLFSAQKPQNSGNNERYASQKLNKTHYKETGMANALVNKRITWNEMVSSLTRKQFEELSNSMANKYANNFLKSAWVGERSFNGLFRAEYKKLFWNTFILSQTRLVQGAHEIRTWNNVSAWRRDHFKLELFF